MSAERTVDARGRVCPVPIIEMAKAIRPLAPGDLVVLLATDPAVRADASAWCEATGHALVSLEESGGTFCVRVRKGSPAPCTAREG